MERGLIMLLHSLIIGVCLYVFMIYVLGQNPMVAEDRSIFFASIILIYMILFGHGLPNTMNQNIMLFKN